MIVHTEDLPTLVFARARKLYRDGVGIGILRQVRMPPLLAGSINWLSQPVTLKIAHHLPRSTAPLLIGGEVNALRRRLSPCALVRVANPADDGRSYDRYRASLGCAAAHRA